MGGMFNLAPLIPELQRDLQLNNTWAAALTSACILSHTILQLPSGQLVDWRGVRLSVFAGLLIMGLATFSTSLFSSAEMLVATRLLAGVGTSVSFVAGLTYANHLVAPRQRVLAQSFYGAGASLGTMLVLIGTQPLVSSFGWRGALVFESAVMVLCGASIVLLMRNPSAAARIGSVSWGQILRDRVIYLLGLAHSITYGMFAAVTTWLVAYLFQHMGVSLQWAGPLSAMLTLTSILGRAFGGLLVEGRERSLILACCSLTVITVALLPLAPGLLLTLLVIMVMGVAVSAPFGAVFTYVSLIRGRAATARELSTINFLSNIGAFGFPLLIGAILDSTHSYLLAFESLALLVGAGLVLLLLWLPRPDPAPVSN